MAGSECAAVIAHEGVGTAMCCIVLSCIHLYLYLRDTGYLLLLTVWVPN